LEESNDDGCRRLRHGLFLSARSQFRKQQLHFPDVSLRIINIQVDHRLFEIQQRFLQLIPSKIEPVILRLLPFRQLHLRLTIQLSGLIKPFLASP
jgi:hypothetical protein